MVAAWLLVLAIIWELPWKGFAMWKAARKKHLIWFLVFLIVHAFAIPEIIYLIITFKRKKRK